MATATASNPTSSESMPAASGPLVVLRRGVQLGRYELLRPIATGGMAHVWAARQTGGFGFARQVAVKVIRPELAGRRSFKAMFLDEARIAARIRHPHVVEVLDLGEESGVLYLAMELVEGSSLATLLRRLRDDGPSSGVGRPPPGIVARIVADMASGLHAAHELADDHGTPLLLVHRDVSPQNILVSLDGITKIADFGVAKAFGRLTDETETGEIKGKLSYLSPEQLRHEPLDRRSDVFSAGIVLWEALTGERLFRGDDVIETLTRVSSRAVPNPCDVAPGVPRSLGEVTLKALDRNPARRYATAAEFSDALDEAARASQLTVSTKELGDFVARLVGRKAEKLRTAIDNDATELDNAQPSSLTRRRGRRAFSVLGLGLSIVLTAAATWRVSSVRASVAGSTGATPTPTAVEHSSAASQVTVPSTDSAQAPLPVSTAVPSPIAAPRAPASALPGRHRIEPSRHPAPQAVPPFSNPY